MTASAGDDTPSGALAVIQESLQGKYSGFASRFIAFVVDVGVSLGVFMLALAAIWFAARVLTGQDIAWHKGDIWVIIAYAVWAFIYFAYSWAASGRTAGMALFGVRVVRDDGTDASGDTPVPPASRAHSMGTDPSLSPSTRTPPSPVCCWNGLVRVG